MPVVILVDEPQVHQAGMPAEHAEVCNQQCVVAGGVQREAAQRGEPASATGPFRLHYTCMPRRAETRRCQEPPKWCAID